MSSLISIVIPSYNYGKYIGNCLFSCLNQGINEEYNVIVIDDGSTDDSVSIIKKYDVTLIKLDKNYGYSKAKNEGIILSRSKYIVHLDADDLLTPDSLQVRLNEFKKDDSLMLVHGRAYNIGEDTTYKWAISNQRKLDYIDCGAQIHAQGVMIKRECYENYGLYDESLKAKADREMWDRLKLIAKVKSKFTPKFVAFYRIHPGSMIWNRDSNPKHNKMVVERYNQAFTLRQREGITPLNTRFINN